MEYINDIYNYFENSARQLGHAIINQIDNLNGGQDPANAQGNNQQPQRSGLFGMITNAYSMFSGLITSNIIDFLNSLEQLGDISLGVQFKIGAVLFFMLLVMFYVNFAFIVPICLGGYKLLHAYFTNTLNVIFGWNLFVAVIVPYLIFVSVSFIVNMFLIFYIYLAGSIIYRFAYNNQGNLFIRIGNGIMYAIGLFCLVLNYLTITQNAIIIKLFSSLISTQVGTFIVYSLFIYSHIIMMLYIYRIIYNYFNTNPAETKTQVFILSYKTFLVIFAFSILLGLSLNGVFINVVTPAFNLLKGVLYSPLIN